MAQVASWPPACFSTGVAAMSMLVLSSVGEFVQARIVFFFGFIVYALYCVDFFAMFIIVVRSFADFVQAGGWALRGAGGVCMYSAVFLAWA